MLEHDEIQDRFSMIVKLHQKFLKKMRKAFTRGKLSQLNGLLLKAGSKVLIDPESWNKMKRNDLKLLNQQSVIEKRG